MTADTSRLRGDVAIARASSSPADAPEPRQGNEHAQPVRYVGDERRAVAVPLGGIGAGHLAIAGDGSLRQWQLANTINHRGHVPDSFFALRVSSIEPPGDVCRTLRSRPMAPLEEPAPLVTDHIEPADDHPPTATWPPVDATDVEVAYPFTTIAVRDEALPLEVSFDAWTPFVPHDPDASGLPVALFTFRLRNPTDRTLHGWLVGTLQNAVGWDGVTPIDGTRCGLFGGNENRLESLDPSGTRPAILMTNPTLPVEDARSGQMLLAADHPAVEILHATSSAGMLRLVETLKLLEPGINFDWSPDAIVAALTTLRRPYVEPDGPSPPGTTWDAALAVPFALRPGEATTIELTYAWWFPNRMADFDQFGPELPVPAGTRLGNRYATRFGSALEVARHVVDRRHELEAASRGWAEAVATFDAPRPIADTIAAQPALVRSPTAFIDEAGRLLGFEGALGASTLNWNGDVGGSCPLNCTHVWNYEQAVAALFPSLEVSMRDLEWDVLQAADGSIPHRLRVPIDGPQLHDRPIGGPLAPALDGMLGAILKTYRDARLGGGRDMLERRYPAMVRLMEHVTSRWADAHEVLRGPQPVTYDIDLTEPNMYVGSLWIAALRTMAAVAARLGQATDVPYEARATTASEAYDALLWNGRYYGRADEADRSGLGSGSLADQLNGQWWAHLLDLGEVLPRDHVRTALRTVVEHNLRDGFRGWAHGFRSFADADDTGLLICTWPDGDRPPDPVRYADEVWSGVEYAVAALCLFEGLDEEALRILAGVRRRYDGTRRNPYNEIECGDHYSRAMAGWSVLHAYTGTFADLLDGRLVIGRRVGTAPLVAGTAWGWVRVAQTGARVEIRRGSLRVATLTARFGATENARVTIDGRPVQADVATGPDGIDIRPTAAMQLDAGSVLEVVG